VFGQLLPPAAKRGSHVKTAKLRVYDRDGESLGELDVTDVQVREAIAKYEREYPLNDYPRTPGRPHVKTWLENKAYKYALRYKGQCYPPKEILRLAIGRRLGAGFRFHGGSGSGKANGVLEDLGFTIARKSVCRDEPKYVFISYAREDESFVLQLAANLKKRGVPIWLDQWSIPPAADWDKAIDDALYECARLLVVLSPASVESREVRSEWRTAFRANKPIVPVLYRPCRIPRQLGLLQYVDFTARGPDDAQALAEVLRALGVPEAFPP
jgi:hypothetical protein